MLTVVQVDSGYNTISAGTASLIDGISSDFQSKESISSNLAEEVFPVNRLGKVKVRLIVGCPFDQARPFIFRYIETYF